MSKSPCSVLPRIAPDQASSDVIQELVREKSLAVLLVEAKSAEGLVVQGLFEQSPFIELHLKPQVVSVKGHDEGLTALKEFHFGFDVILVDYDLAPQNGLFFLECAARLKNEAPVIVLTEELDYGLEIEAIRRGAADCLEKALLNPQKLERAIRYSIERSRIVAELTVANAENRTVLESARCLLITTDVSDGEGYLRFWNETIKNEDAAQALLPLDIPIGGTYGQAFHDAKVPQDMDVAHKVVDEAIRNGRDGYQLEYRVKKSSGEICWISEDTRIESTAPGRWKLTGVYTDITDRILAESKIRLQSAMLEEDRTRLANAQSLAKIGSWSFDVVTQTLSISDELYRMAGSTPRETGATWDDLFECFRWEDWPLIMDGEMFELGKPNPPPDHVVRTRRPNLECKYLLSRTRAIYDGHGVRVRVDGTMADITRIHEVEEELRNTNALLEVRVADRVAELEVANRDLVAAKEVADRANLAKSEFLSRMSHELRTPLNAILGFGQVLQRRELEPRDQEGVQHILKAGRHLLHLVNETLDFARVEGGHIEVSIEPVDLLQVVRECLELTRVLGKEQQVHLSLQQESTGKMIVLADQHRLKQVIINLLSNAIKYNSPGGTVVVECRSAPGNRIRIEVRDTGMGIQPDDVQKLFVPFERLGAQRSSIEGTGLGLSLSHRLVALMGGTLEVESVLGKGSRFSFEMPEAHSIESGIMSRNGDEQLLRDQADSARKQTVLCIEDNPLNLRLIESIFSSRPNIKLLSASHGQMGVEMSLRVRPDLVLLDLNLPDISGREVLEALRESEAMRDRPVVIVSADATKSQIAGLLSSGADAYLTKPIDIPELLRVVDEKLGAPDI